MRKASLWESASSSNPSTECTFPSASLFPWLSARTRSVSAATEDFSAPMNIFMSADPSLSFASEPSWESEERKRDASLALSAMLSIFSRRLRMSSLTPPKNAPSAILRLSSR